MSILGGLVCADRRNRSDGDVRIVNRLTGRFEVIVRGSECVYCGVSDYMVEEKA